MPNFSADLSLLLFTILNIALFGCAWFFASRVLTQSRSQAILDAAVLGYLIQFVSVAVPGLLHCLQFFSIVSTALSLMIILFAAAWRKRLASAPLPFWIEQTDLLGIALFSLTFILLFAHSQASLPVISNDAMTYHFPAAVQWLQQKKISLFHTWFFNPANTYSPLAGSMFIVWMIAPFHSDVLARFVEVPALICVGIAMYCLCRQLGAMPVLAALISAAAMFARPVFLPSMMGKDDLFVAFFFLAALIALTPPRAAERFGQIRFGIALGLLLAIKYTALLSVPILLLAMNGPGWRWRGWLLAVLVASALAGPWYLRNSILTGNPVFPMFSLFTTSSSEAFHPWPKAGAILFDGAYGLPSAIAALFIIPWLQCFVAVKNAGRSSIPRRACAIGIPLGFAIFFLQSPFPEIRFVLPVFLLLFACVAHWPGRYCLDKKLQLLIGLPLLLLSLITVFGIAQAEVSIKLAGIALVVSFVGMVAVILAKHRPLRLTLIALPLLLLLTFYSYINWTAYCRNNRESLYDDGGAYALEYPDATLLWRFVNQNIPSDATLAYSNMYLVYPLQGTSLQRRLIYAPTRSGLTTIADLGWLGKNLSGEKLIPAAVRATVAEPNRSTWLKNLRSSGAKYLVIGHGGVVGIPPEQTFAVEDPTQFHCMFTGPAGTVYAVELKK